MRVCGATDVGMIRSINQDNIFTSIDKVGCLPNLFVVADGMGGHKAGDIASRYTVDSLVRKLSQAESGDYINLINEAIVAVNSEIIEKAQENLDYEGMGTTLVVATIFNNILKVANVGDSRLYVCGQEITQITRDHSYVEEMIGKGELDRMDARTDRRKNFITRAIGGEKQVEAEIFTVELNPTDKILMCSDGLSNMLEDQEILEIVSENSDIDMAVRCLIDKANERGGRDNISVILVEQ